MDASNLGADNTDELDAADLQLAGSGAMEGIVDNENGEEETGPQTESDYNNAGGTHDPTSPVETIEPATRMFRASINPFALSRLEASSYESPAYDFTSDLQQPPPVVRHSQNQEARALTSKRRMDNDPVDSPVPPYLKDISSLASWTVSSHKPGCGVAALRHPSTNYFWQSDGPQPHILNIHFFKLVLIAHIRIYLDHSLDESYTPTRILFLAGTGHHDLQQVCEMRTETPRGWLAVDLSNAGGPAVLEGDEEDDYDEDDDDEDDEQGDEEARAERARRRAQRRRIGRGGTLRAFLVQLQILENHQNGKDTHLRGLQIFAKDESYARRARKRPRASASPVRAVEARADGRPSEGKAASPGKMQRERARDITDGLVGLREPDWMGEPELR